MTLTTAPQIYTRPGEIILKVLNDHVGYCTRSNKLCVSARAAWADRPDSWFSVNRHIDSTSCITHPSYKPEGEIQSSCFLKPACPDCGAIDQFNRRDTGYGWDVTCTACSVSHYYDSGD